MIAKVLIRLNTVKINTIDFFPKIVGCFGQINLKHLMKLAIFIFNSIDL